MLGVLHKNQGVITHPGGLDASLASSANIQAGPSSVALHGECWSPARSHCSWKYQLTLCIFAWQPTGITGYSRSEVQNHSPAREWYHAATRCLRITLADVDRFSKFFHPLLIRKKIYVYATKVSALPAVCCYTTLPCEIRKSKNVTLIVLPYLDAGCMPVKSLISWWRKSSNMTVGQSSLIYLAHHCYDWHPGSRCG